MYTYPEVLDAFQKIATDLLRAAKDARQVIVQPDAQTGTASVVWDYHTVTINLPVRPATSKMTAKEFEHWCGYIYHEVGHPLETDKAVWNDAIRTGDTPMLNSLEDVRMEKRMIQRGLVKNAQSVLGNLLADIYGDSEANGFNPNDPTNIGWTMAVLGRADNGYGIEAERLTSKLIPGEAVHGILPWARSELASCKTTQHCLTLARKITNALPKSQGKSKGNENGKPQDGQGNGQGSDASGSAKEAQQEAQAGNKASNQGKSQDGAGNGAGGLTGKDVKPVDLAPAKHKDDIPGGTNRAMQAAAITSLIRNAKAQQNRSRTINDRERNERMVRDAGKASRLRGLLAKALRRAETDEYEGGRRHGRLDRRAFAGVAAGSKEVFGKRILSDGYETDLTVLIDMSGSMSGENIKTAATFGLVVAQAASQVGVACTVQTFGPGGFGTVKKASDKLDDMAFGALPRNVGGGTPLSVCMLKAAMQQSARAPHKRRVMFVLSDGQCDQGPWTVKAAADYVETALGIELAHLSIGTACTKTFRNEAAVWDTGSVTSVGLDMLTRTLEKAA
jgi:cobalamin biosynthesis protein CobT